MGLESRYRAAFSKSDREKGETLTGAVTVFEGSADRLVCEIKDNSGLYEVILECNGSNAEFLCECTGIKNKTCQHLWAAVLNADKYKLFKNGYLINIIIISLLLSNREK